MTVNDDPAKMADWFEQKFGADPLPVKDVACILQQSWIPKWKNGDRWTTMPVSFAKLVEALDHEGTGQVRADHDTAARLCEHMRFLPHPENGQEAPAYVWHNDNGVAALRITSYTRLDGSHKSALLRLVDHDGRHSHPTIVGPTGAAFIASHLLLSAYGPDMVDPASVPALTLDRDQVRQAVEQASPNGDGVEVADAVWELVAPHLTAAGLGELVDTAALLRDLVQTRRDLKQTRSSLSAARAEYEQLRGSLQQKPPAHPGEGEETVKAVSDARGAGRTATEMIPEQTEALACPEHDGDCYISTDRAVPLPLTYTCPGCGRSWTWHIGQPFTPEEGETWCTGCGDQTPLRDCPASPDLDAIRARHTHPDVADLLGLIDRLAQQRDLAIAHDRQPYPTAHAYEQTCRALEAQRRRAQDAQARLEAVLAQVAGLAEEFRTALEHGSMGNDPGWEGCMRANLPHLEQILSAGDIRPARFRDRRGDVWEVEGENLRLIGVDPKRWEELGTLLPRSVVEQRHGPLALMPDPHDPADPLSLDRRLAAAEELLGELSGLVEGHSLDLAALKNAQAEQSPSA